MGVMTHKMGTQTHKMGAKPLLIRNNIIITCEYCDKQISHSKHLQRHYRNCKEKKNKLLIKKIELDKINYELKCKELEEELYEKKNMVIEKRNIEQQFKKFKEMYLEHMKALMDENKTSKISNYNVYNMYYVQQNFQDAYNYEDLMAPPLTQDEIHLLENNDVTFGAFNLFKGRCIDNIELDKRPIHLIDMSRKKYMIRLNGSWFEDKNGEQIFEGITKKITSVYLTENDGDSLEVKLLKLSNCGKLYGKKNNILDYANDFLALKNNASKPEKTDVVELK
jgi:hypothetical protein